MKQPRKQGPKNKKQGGLPPPNGHEITNIIREGFSGVLTFVVVIAFVHRLSSIYIYIMYGRSFVSKGGTKTCCGGVRWLSAW